MRKRVNNEKWGPLDDELKFQTRTNMIIFLSFRRTVIEAVYNKLNPYRSDDTVSFQTFFCHLFLPFSFAWLVIRMAFDKWPAFLTNCLHPFNKILKPNILFVKLNDSQLDSEKYCKPILWYMLCHHNLAKNLDYLPLLLIISRQCRLSNVKKKIMKLARICLGKAKIVIHAANGSFKRHCLWVICFQTTSLLTLVSQLL